MWVILPPDDVSNKVDSVRKQFAASYGCKAGLKNPIHITLQAPFWETDDVIEEMQSRVSDTLARILPFSIKLSGFGSFKKNGVIYIGVEESSKLIELHNELTSTLSTLFTDPSAIEKRPYHPHVTIAYRDIPPPLFNRAWNEYREMDFQASFMVDKVHLWRHDSLKWISLREYHLAVSANRK